ncbi:MAG: nitrous oxide-stimulated promoter family protein, partial [Candidatus Kapaibacteriota bacterium]
MLKLITSRLYREKVTITEMIKLHCRKVHNHGGGLCEECSELLSYALKRIEYCPFSIDKPACNQC